MKVVENDFIKYWIEEGILYSQFKRNTEGTLENEEISWSRYNSYLKLLEGDEENYRTDIYDEDRKNSDKSRG